MAFQPNDRVEMATCNHKGTIQKDDDNFVWVRWDDGQIGIMEYNRNVVFNAYRLLKCKKQ